jgi:hypothetical protein
MNLVQLANDLEYVPRKELAEMSQDPNSSYPAYLVLSEIQRRTLNDKNFAAMQERPTTTVAEEVVDEFMQPQLAENQSQGLQVGAPQSATPLPDSNISAGLSGVPTAPMQMAASGGATGYANKGKTEYKEYADDYGKQLQEIFEKEGRYKKRYSDYEKGERFTYPLTPRDYVVSDEEYSRLKEGDYVMGEGALQEYRPFLMLLNALDGESGARYMPESEVKGLKAKLKASIMEDKLSQMGMAEGGITGYAAGDRTALNASFQNPNANQFLSTSNQDIPKEILEEVETIGSSRGADFLKFAGVLKEDGSIDPLGATLAVASLYPAGRAAGWVAKAGIGIGKKYLPGIASGIKGLAQSAYKKGFTKTGQVPAEITRKGQSLPLGQAAKELGYGKGTSNIMTRGDVFSPAKTLGTLSTAAVPAAIVKNISDSSQEQYAIDKAEKERLKNLENTKPIMSKIESDLMFEAEKARKAREKRETKQTKGLGQMDYRDMIRMGVGIMGAKDMSELGSSVTGVLDAQDKREVQGLQSRYMQIQTEKLEADIAAMPLKELIDAQNSLSASIKAKNESGSMLTPEEIIEINKLYEFYNAEIARRQGFVASSGLTKEEQEAMNKFAAG